MSTGVTTPVSAASLRPLTLAVDSLEHVIPVPTALFSSGVALRDRFLRDVAADKEDETTASFESTDELMAAFLGKIAELSEEADDPSIVDFLEVVLSEFETRFLCGNDVHTLAASLENPDAVVRSYFLARQVANKPIRAHASALLRTVEEGHAKIAAIFGGQGTSEEYFDELSSVYNTYGGMVRPLIAKASKLLQNLVVSTPTASKVYTEGLDPLSWIEKPETRPSNDYLVMAPVSVPVIGIIQLVHFEVTCRVLGLTPGQLRKFVSGATGHSQGLVVALAIAAADSWTDYDTVATKALKTLFFIGFRCQQAFPITSLLPSVLKDSIDNNEGAPTPMLAVRDLSLERVQKFIDQTNKFLPSDQHIAISLINGPRSFVISGPPMSLYGFNRAVRKIKGPVEPRTPYSQRPAKVTNRFLPITVPFHSYLLKSRTQQIVDDVLAHDAAFKTSDLSFAVYDTFRGKDLRESESVDALTFELIKLITEEPVHWVTATEFDSDLTHILDFGPGGTSGMALLTHRIKDGRGVRVIVAGVTNGHPIYDELGYKQEIFDRSWNSVCYGVDWVKSFGPRLAKTQKGDVIVDTKFSRLLGRPPIMVPAMTPCTVKPEVVAATLNSGYHIELAGGGYFLPGQMRTALERVRELTPPGVGISINVLYVNPMMLQWAIPLVRQLRSEGFPIEGMSVGAGVPSLDVANEYIRTLGLKHLSFKPGTVESIRQSVQIAAANPDFPVLIQWTGGRGGGHHSYEDFHQPILSTYSQIRKQGNIILVAGSGFGDAEGTYPYLTGEWSTKYGYPPMPFDGFLMGSRTMVAKEFFTSYDAKQAIVAAPGVPDSQWEGTYKKPTGGILTVMSEMGEPIHKLATRGVLLWKDLDDTIFSLPRNKRVAALAARKPTIIKRLNDDFQKPWFGRKSDGRVVDLDDMTYLEIVERMVSLMFVKSQNRWIDVSLRDLTAKFVRRLEERLASGVRSSVLQSAVQLDSPEEFIKTLVKEYPTAATQVVNAQDKDYFLNICLERNHKPVPFVPALDENFEYYFKKDSLWQSEDLDAVIGKDVGRTCILQGPVAAKFSDKVNEPIGEMLDRIHNGHIQRLEADGIKPSEVECFGSPEGSHDDIEFLYPSVRVLRDGDTRTLSIDEVGAVPALKDWLTAIAGNHGWMKALLLSSRITQDKKQIPNALQEVFEPVRGISVRTTPSSIELVDGKSVVVSVSYENPNISVSLSAPGAQGKTYYLPLKYVYHPETGYAPISESTEGRNNRIKEFYWQLWFGSLDGVEAALGTKDLTSSWESDEPVRITRQSILDFVHAVNNRGEAYIDLPNRSKVQAPMDFAIVLGWKAIIRAIFPELVDGDLLKLVHLSNGFNMRTGVESLSEGDEVSTTARITSVSIAPAGKTITVTGTLLRNGEAVMDVNSQFLYRGNFTDYESTFRIMEEQPVQLKLETAKDVAILRSKEWFHPSTEDLIGKKLTVRCRSTVHYKTANKFREIETTGEVLHVLPTKEVIEVGRVSYTAGESVGNPVVDYLERVGKPIEQPVAFERPIPLSVEPLVTRAPASNELYASVSGDYNPIHVSRAFANYVGLPGTITHGMYSSASVRALVEVWAAENHNERVRAFTCQFVGMVLPNDVLQTYLEHWGMVAGRKIIKIRTVKKLADGGDEPVLTGEAEVEQPTTAYVFTGQGSQEQGMGMELYNSSEVAREVWDRADRHFVSSYGISILDIVRNNPKELTVHFGGAQGKRIRDNYKSMVFETIDDATGEIKSERIFKSITDETDSYTYVSDTGVLSMTQFTQPALTLLEKAAFEDMRSRGLVDSMSCFAGHSLGEYSALASMADVMSIESLVDVVFYRGMTMQVAVPRDSQGRSNYSMCAVNPSRVSPTFSEEALRLVVSECSRVTGWLLEIVNFNVANQQYVTAGDLRGLDTLTNVLNVIKLQKIDIDKLQQLMSLDEVKAHLSEIIQECAAKSVAKPQPIALERGFAVIPLPGISVPFHSSYLRSGVKPFKTFLAKRVPRNAVKPAALVSKYIPNLTAKPFEVTKEYFQEVYDLTKSDEIKRILDNWDEITGQ